MELAGQISGQVRALLRWLRILPKEQSPTLLPLRSPLLVDQTAPVEVQRAPTVRDQIANTLRPDLPWVRTHRWVLKSLITMAASLLWRFGFSRVHFSVVCKIVSESKLASWMQTLEDPLLRSLRGLFCCGVGGVLSHVYMMDSLEN